MEGTWLAFVMHWCLVYKDYLNRQRTDQGFAFMPDQWRQLANTNGFQLRISGTDAHRSICISERYHGLLCRTCQKSVFANSTASPPYLLKVAVEAMIDTMGENGHVPCRLVIGIIPRFRILSTEITQQKGRMEALKSAQAKNNSNIAQRRVHEALKRKSL